jgi:hypothetical protein
VTSEQMPPRSVSDAGGVFIADPINRLLDFENVP